MTSGSSAAARRAGATPASTPIASDTASASAAIVAPTGDAAVRLSWRTPIFVSGAGFPDVLLLDRSMLTDAEAGIRAAGFFGPDWSLERGEVVTRVRGDDPARPAEDAR